MTDDRKSLLTLDAPGDSADKNFAYFRASMGVKVGERPADLDAPTFGAGPSLVGFLGSPNFLHVFWDREDDTCCIDAIAHHPHLNRLISGGYDGTLKIWDSLNGRELCHLIGHSRWVTACVFSDCGTYFATASGDQTVKLWEFSSGRCIKTINIGPTPTSEPHRFAIGCLALRRDGLSVVCGSKQGRLIACDANSGQELWSLQAHEGEVSSCQFSPCGRFVISVGSRGTSKRLAEDGSQVECKFREERFYQSCISADGRTACMVNSLSETLVLLDLESGSVLHEFDRSDGCLPDNISRCAFSPDGRSLLSADLGGRLLLWDLADRIRLRDWSSKRLFDFGLREWTNRGWDCCAFHPGSHIAYAGEYSRIVAWNCERDCQALRPVGHEGVPVFCEFSPDGEQLISATESDTFVWSVTTGELLRNFERGIVPPMGTISRDGRTACSGGVLVWSLDNGRELQKMTHRDRDVSSSAFSCDCRSMVFGFEDGGLKLWGALGSRNAKAFKSADSIVTACAFSTGDTLILTGHKDGTIGVWDAEKRRRLRAIGGHMGSITQCRFLPDGARFVSSSADGSLRIWNSKTGEEEKAFLGHSDAVTGFVLDESGERVVSLSKDRTMRLWNVETGLLLKIWSFPTEVRHAAWSPRDSNLLAVAGPFGAVTLWKIDGEK